MTEELYIEGKQVDLMPNKVTRNLQIGKLGDVADRESSYSNTVKLPLTAKNIEIFEFLGVTGNVSRHQYKKLKCRYIVDGIPLINNGYCVVQSLTEAYEVVLYDGIIDIGEALKDKNISELNYNDINHYLSPENFKNNMNNTGGFIYALGNFGVPRNENGSYQSEYIAPSLYVSELFDRILTQNGFQYTGRFFNENEHFLTEVIAPGKGYNVTNEEFEAIDLGEAQTDRINRYEISSRPISFEDKHELTTVDIDNTTYDATNKELIFNFDGEINIATDSSHRLSRGNSTMRVYILYKLNGEIVVEDRLSQYQQSSTNNITMRVRPGDKLSIWVKGTDAYAYMYDDPAYDSSFRPPRHSGGDGITGGYEFIINDYDQYLEDRFNTYQYSVNYTVLTSLSITQTSSGQLIKFEELVPDLGQLAFIKDTVQRYGLLIRPIKNTNVYEFIQFEELLNDKTKAEDWSDKYVATREEKYDTTYGRTNEAKYNYPSEIEVPTHDGLISVDVETLENKSTMFSSPYTISYSDKKFLGQPFYQIPIWEHDPEGEDEEGNQITIIENVETAPRIFRISRVESTVKLKYFNANTTEVFGDLPILSLNNLNMQFFLNNYYKAFKGVIDTYKEVHMDMFFNEIDIYNLNFFRLKYLKQYGKYFYLNKLRYSAGEVGVGVFIELNKFSSNEVPTELANITVNMTKNMRYKLPMEAFYAGYSDPEFDNIKAIRITSGFSHRDITLRANRYIITSESVIPVVNGQINLDVVERSLNLLEDSNVFTYEVMDEGSGKWSEVQGTINVNVLPYVNEAPSIDLIFTGTLFTIDRTPPEGQELFSMGLWAASSDTTGNIVSHSWEVLYQPEGSVITINDADTAFAMVRVPHSTASIGKYKFRYTVCDSWGACSIGDSMEITVRDQQSRPSTGGPDSPYRG